MSLLGKGAFHSEGADASVALNLTALMDILSNLLFFLLASYSAQAVEAETKADLKLPSSSSQQKLEPSLTVTATRKELLVAGVTVAQIDNNKIVGSPDSDDRIAPLYDRLVNVRSARQAAGRDDLPGSDLVLLMADHTLDATLITRVLKTAGSAGYVNIKFGVISQ